MRICCVNVGAKYSPIYVERLYRGLVKNTTKPFTFECKTESKFSGWWAKLEYFNPSERTILIDLDHAVTGNCDFLFDYDGPFCLRRNDWSPKRYDVSLMSIAPGSGKRALDFLLDRPNLVMGTFRSDQEFLPAMLDLSDVWQDIAPGKTKSYKIDKLDDGPQGASLVHFHGYPKMTDLPKGHWIEEYWR